MNNYYGVVPEPDKRVATNPCVLKPSFTRLVACSEGRRIAVGYAALFAVIAWGVGRWAWWWLSLPLWLVSVFFLVILVLGWFASILFYDSGDMAAGVISCEYPLHTVVLVDVRKYGDIPRYGLVLLQNDCPKLFAPKIGSHVVCIVSYRGGTDDYFDTISGQPVCLGTWSTQALQKRYESIPQREFGLIESAIKDGIAPKVPKHVELLDPAYLESHGFLIEEPNKQPSPPPLPSRPPPLPGNDVRA